MAYTAWSVVFGEQPTAAKWNQLGANDAGFKDGTNIDALAITGAKIAASTITGDKLATSAIKLGRTIVTTTVTPSGSTETTIASVTVTVPAGGRDLLLMITAPQILPNDGTRMQIKFKEGATSLQAYYHVAQGSGETFLHLISAPTAGSHTYTVTSTRDSGAGTTQWYADNIAPSQIELVAFLV